MKLNSNDKIPDMKVLEYGTWLKLPKFVLTSPLVLNHQILYAGTVTDGGTIPWLIRLFINPIGKHFLASVIHDEDRRLSKTLKQRLHADRKYLNNLKYLKINPILTYVLYYGVSTYSYLKSGYEFILNKIRN